MNILVLSDLHLSNHDHFSAFGWNEDAFLRKLDLICTMYGVEKIVLNGDILELCKYRWHEIIRSNSRILSYFAVNKTVYLRGNHDFRADDSLDHYNIVNSNGQSIHIEHGHKADFFGGTKIGRFLNDALFRGLKFLFGLSPVRVLYFGILHREEGIVGQRKYNSYDYLRYALGLLAQHDVVILGHTHEIEAHQSYRKSKSKLYLNCGTCTFGRFQGIVMDTESLRYELIRIDADQQITDGDKNWLLPERTQIALSNAAG
ncbi:MAG: metallophosphoesterase [Chitinispirillaceae bacterium]|jgi:predicted phosphodiesterase